jgi:hypothetical protein
LFILTHPGKAENMKITFAQVKRLGFVYHDGDDTYRRGGVHLYNHPMKEGWTIESVKPERQIYSVKALVRHILKTL